jgi:putative thioredoxin
MHSVEDRSLPTHVDVPPGQFEAAVVEESRRRPVVVDFWAPWCGPCRTLGPILERLATEAGGAWLLAKVNVDADAEVAARFGVQGIPAVKAFRDGAVASEFVGALPEGRVRSWLEGVVPGPADAAFAEAEAAIRTGTPAAAREALGRVLASKASHGGALLALAELDLAEGRRAEALARLERIPPADADRHSSRLAALRLRASAPADADVGALRRKVEAHPGDGEARVALARGLAGKGEYPAALEELLEVVRRFHRKGPGEEARAFMVELFDVIGARSELADAYRTRLSRELYR